MALHAWRPARLSSFSNHHGLCSPYRHAVITEWGNAVDRAKAKDAGIEWQRPKDDHRTAEDIIHDSPLLNNLGNQSGVKDKLRERVGDFEHDADAAYRAKQVLEHVERFDETGSRLAGNDIDNGRVDGFTKGGGAKHGTEAGRLQDFGKYGWENLKTDQHAALASFYATATSLQSILGIDDAKAMQSAVAKSSHNEDFKTFYEDQLASGERMRELLKNNTPEQAASEFSLEVALYNSALDPQFTAQYDQQLNDNFSSIAQENLFKGAGFDNIKTAFGKEGGAELDEDKVRKLVDQMRQASHGWSRKGRRRSSRTSSAKCWVTQSSDMASMGSRMGRLRIFQPRIGQVGRSGRREVGLSSRGWTGQVHPVRSWIWAGPVGSGCSTEPLANGLCRLIHLTSA